MKVPGGAPRDGYRQEIQLSRPNGDVWRLTIRPLGLGFSRDLRRHGIFAPECPTRIARDSQGRPMRDAQGMAVMIAAKEDRDFQLAMEVYHQRVAALMIAEGLEGDPQFQFETVRPDKQECWGNYADELLRELEESGWSLGDVAHVCQEVAKLSRLLPEHLQEGEGAFFPRQEGTGRT